MKPNVFKFSTIITFISMLIAITESHVTECWIMTMYNKNSKSYVNVHNNNVYANSTEKYPLYAINLEQSIKFYLYDPRTDKFICMDNKRKLQLRKFPKTEESCTYEDKVLYVKNTSTPYIQYYQPHFKETFKFTRKGLQYTMKKLRHNHTRKNTKSLLRNMSGFLPNKYQLEKQECVSLKHSFCCNMRKSNRLPKLPESLRTLCEGILNFQAYLKCE